MFLSFKFWIENIVFKNPKAMGWLVFSLILALTMSISYADYLLRLADEQNQVDTKLTEIEQSFNIALNDAVSAGKTLAFLAKNHDISQNFEEIGRQILENNPTVDVLQLLDSGKVVANYPSQGNEAVMGYNILHGPRSEEAEKAILSNKMLFAGPFELIQGGRGIIGRLPFFENGNLSGFSSVIIYLDTLLEAVHIQNSQESLFHIQLAKTNPNSGELEKFLPEPADQNEYSKVKTGTLLRSGNWYVTVQLKESTAVWNSIPVVLLRILLSIALGLIAWTFAKQPSILSRKVKEQSKTILESNERFEYATKATSDIIWDWDLVNNQVYRSGLFSEKFGYSNSQKTNKADFWTSIIHPDDLEEVVQNMVSVLTGQDTYWEKEFRIRKSDQTYAYVRN